MPPCPVLAVEHRLHRRYPLNFDVQCRVAHSDQVCSGKIVDMSSAGICFLCSEVFPRGTYLELAIDWPVSLDNVLLQVRITGRVLRQDKRGTAIETLRYEFHTRKIRPADQIAMPSEIRVA
jgi:hypothetical protein